MSFEFETSTCFSELIPLITFCVFSQTTVRRQYLFRQRRQWYRNVLILCDYIYLRLIPILLRVVFFYQSYDSLSSVTTSSDGGNVYSRHMSQDSRESGNNLLYFLKAFQTSKRVLCFCFRLKVKQRKVIRGPSH